MTISKLVLPVLFTIFIFTFYAYITLRLNIHGDSKFHTLFAKETIESSTITRVQSYRLWGFENDERIYMPIAYPLTSVSLFSIFYLIGGEMFLKLYSPIMASIVFLLLFLILREFEILKACSIACLVTILIGERFIMTPLIEPYVLVLLISHIYILKKYFSDHNIKYLVLASIFLGVSVAVKQQGLMFAVFVISFFVIYYCYVTYFKLITFKKALLHFSVFFVLLFILPLPAIKEQISRTGTFAFSPGKTELPRSLPLYHLVQPALASKFVVSLDAMKALENTISYNKIKLGLVDKFKGFIMSPFIYYRSSYGVFYNSVTSSIFLIIILLLCFRLIAYRKVNNSYSPFWIFIVLSLLFEVVSSYALKTPVNQYHIYGVAISSLLVMLIFFDTRGLLRPYVGLALSVTISVILVISYFKYIYPLWSDSGREDDYHLNGYKLVGEYVKKNTDTDSVFLAGEVSFRYYAQRDAIWLNENIGHDFWNAIYADSDSVAVQYLNRLGVDYVMFNREQTNRKGVFDYMPPDGLASYINRSSKFVKLFDAYGDGEMVVYKVNY